MSGWRRPPRGLTLIELVVAISVLILLGSLLIAILNQGMRLWRATDGQRRTMEEAGLILDRLCQDLGSMVVADHSVISFGGSPLPPRIRLLSLPDGAGRARIAFVRHFSEELTNPITADAGWTIGGDAAYDGYRDREELLDGTLRAPGGLLEVAYLLDPAGGNRLLRGIRAPVGDATSLLEVALDPAPPADLLATRFKLLSERVLHIEYAFWTPWTGSWDETLGLDPTATTVQGPASWWDSTRGTLLGAPPAAFPFMIGPASEPDASDDLFPAAIRIRLVLEDQGSLYPLIMRRPLGLDDEAILVADGRAFSEQGGWVKVDDEWIRYRAVDGNELLIAERGARGTSAADHSGTRLVQIGRTFERVVTIQAYREDWR